MATSFDLHLQPRDKRRQPLHLVWDVDAGTIGPEARMQLEGYIDYHLESGEIGARPHPWSIPFDDPFRKPEQLVALLAFFYHLPPELERHYPKYTGAPTPPGTVN